MFTRVKFLRWQGQTVNNCNVNIWWNYSLQFQIIVWREIMAINNTPFLINRVSYSSRFMKPSFTSILYVWTASKLLLMLLLSGPQRGERVEIVRTGETNEPQRIRALLCGVCVQCRAHGTVVAAKSGPRRRQSCDLGK